MSKCDIQNLIEKVVDNDVTQYEVYYLMDYFINEIEHYEYFVMYSLLRKLYPKDKKPKIPLF